ncbi:MULTISPECIES: hypothetical protein [unclassified Empedobacter]|uniref:hypothetical protein n=1 Tax=unclassified Empedobacter TaxID=2643773 RepID=UPI0025C37F54|nr:MULTISPECIES: hypothetical protein [unclassified Empedobacter]
MSEVENYLQKKKYLERSDFPKVFKMDFRTFENYYVKASSNQDRRISKAKIDIIKIPKNKRTKQLFKTSDVVDFLSLHGIYPLDFLNIKKAPVAPEA